MWPRKKKSLETQTPLPIDTARVATDSGKAAVGAVFSPLREAPPTSETLAFDRLRTETHALMRTEYADRIAANPTPTPRELALGMYAENLEPQVRNATFQMREKGYQTCASGFFGADCTWRIIGIEGEDVPRGTYRQTYDQAHKRAQTMDFSQGFELDQATHDRLAEMGAEAVYHPSDGLIHRIGFVPDTPDLAAITTQWDMVATALPAAGPPVPPATAFEARFSDWGATAP